MGGEEENIAIPPPPPVSWAQRDAVVYVIFNVECEKPQIEFTTNTIDFRGACGPNGDTRAVHIQLYAAIQPENSTIDNKGRFIEVVLAKARADEPWWPALTSDKFKHHWLKVDFERWQDEEENDEDKYDDMDMFSNLGDEPLGDDDSSSDKEEDDLPDLE